MEFSENLSLNLKKKEHKRKLHNSTGKSNEPKFTTKVPTISLELTMASIILVPHYQKMNLYDLIDTVIEAAKFSQEEGQNTLVFLDFLDLVCQDTIKKSNICKSQMLLNIQYRKT